MNIEDFKGVIGRIHREELRSVRRKGYRPNVAALKRHERNLGLCRESCQQQEEACQEQQRTTRLGSVTRRIDTEALELVRLRDMS